MYDLKLLVFDWDGTLMDSEAQIVGCMQAAICDLDLEPRSPEQIKDIIGLGLREAVERLYPGQPADFATRMAARYREHWLARPEEAALFPGVEETLRLLREEGFQLAVATGKGRQGLDKVLAATGLDALFHATRCSDETRSKPHPQMLRELMQVCGARPGQTLMIGDTEYDMAMARNAGAHPLAVSYGVHDWQRLQQHRPLACIDQITDLNDWLAEQRCDYQQGEAPIVSEAG
ncbi:HAD-IA family hydrolase [Thiohalobacter sp. IOR34]|uniref:HAD family hydrolase n=1 Tax=Thiohalobacter sp. IOR34 TaxID=3057176 RepID=UPI0025B18329|nr:HAD-IA family hydrolase [Thiohalobacter sp. IOR34]WJW74238.1 HAD-IA family hydrolase [Thiohalobacter sp. IOR34]